MGFGIGNVLATTVRVWLRHLPRLVVLTFLFSIPIYAWYLLHHVDAARSLIDELYYEPFAGLHPAITEATGASWITHAFAGAAIAVVVVGRLRGERPGIGTGIATAVRRGLAVVGVAFLARLATTGVLVLVSVVVWTEYEYLRQFSAHLFWFVAWIVLASFVFVVVPIAAVERRGVLSSIRRALSLDHRVKVFVILLVEQVAIVGVYMLLRELVLSTPGDDMEEFQRRFAIYAYAKLGLGLLTSSFGAVLAAVTYERLRAAKDGPTAHELDRVFE